MISPDGLAFDWSETLDDLPADNMRRASHAKNLTLFLVQKGQNDNYVLNLNAKWGTGKSYFLKRWVKEIEQTYPTVYIDAWSSDHSSDPLLSVVSEVKNRLKELKEISKFEQRLFEGVAKAVKATAPAVIKAVVKNQLERAGVNLNELGDVISNDDAADAGAKLVEQAIKAHNEASVGVKSIKSSVQGWMQSVVESKKRRYPLFIFIDELDRCRPTYAIEMLETIKHIFDMKNVVFVIATDKDQLQHSIKAIYGAEFDSRLYLDRFFSRTVTLSNPSRVDFIRRKLAESKFFSDYFSDDSNFVFLPSKSGRTEDIILLFAAIADGFDWPLRNVSLWLDRLEAALIISSIKLDVIILSFMMALETDNTEWLKKYQEEIPIFKSKGSDDLGKINFRTSLITTTWSFNQTKKELLAAGMKQTGSQINSVNESEVSILDFVIDRIEFLKMIDIFNSRVMVNEYRQLLQTGEVSVQSFGEGINKTEYPVPALYIYMNYHKLRGITLDHYIEICRYSSLID
ncbi:P-loop NTPase fold protein [Pantoea agglomerans]|uniref:KAP family P-loop NTPase fold protein n=1 Tax=Enterobacter agglomerans TaxID=549 RepID=UPI00320892B8